MAFTVKDLMDTLEELEYEPKMVIVAGMARRSIVGVSETPDGMVHLSLGDKIPWEG